MYNEGLDSDLCNWMEEKVKCTFYMKIADIPSLLGGGLFWNQTEPEAFQDYCAIVPLFNYDSCTSSNPKDHTEGTILILEKNPDTMLYFKSNTPIMNYKEMKTETIIDNIRYTLYYTYDETTGEPAPGKMTSNGNVTDEHGYYLDSEVIT